MLKKSIKINATTHVTNLGGGQFITDTLGKVIELEPVYILKNYYSYDVPERIIRLALEQLELPHLEIGDTWHHRSLYFDAEKMRHVAKAFQFIDERYVDWRKRRSFLSAFFGGENGFDEKKKAAVLDAAKGIIIKGRL